VVAVCMAFSLKFTYLWEHAALFTLSGGVPEVCTWPDVSQLGAGPIQVSVFPAVWIISIKYHYVLSVLCFVR
jgi:hypothetical protein